MLNNRLLWQNGLRVQAVMDQGSNPNSVGYQGRGRRHLPDRADRAEI